MNATTAPFQNPRAELSLKRRSIARPIESGTPFQEDDAQPSRPGLPSGWDKLYRARSILEAEQAHLRDDRIALKGEIDALADRERQIAMREQRIQQVEMRAQLAMADSEERNEAGSAIAKLTRAPFNIARSMFGGRK
ncbi:MAG TPA: hypothetical protein VGG37_05725 [Opitutaceae bacterium]